MISIADELTKVGAEVDTYVAGFTFKMLGFVNKLSIRIGL